MFYCHRKRTFVHIFYYSSQSGSELVIDYKISSLDNKNQVELNKTIKKKSTILRNKKSNAPSLLLILCSNGM